MFEQQECQMVQGFEYHITTGRIVYFL